MMVVTDLTALMVVTAPMGRQAPKVLKALRVPLVMMVVTDLTALMVVTAPMGRQAPKDPKDPKDPRVTMVINMQLSKVLNLEFTLA
jgi:hypothetical protein